MSNSVVRVLPQAVTLYGSSMLGGGAVPAGQPLEMEGAPHPGVVTKNGLVLYGTDGKAVSAAVIQETTSWTVSVALLLKVLCCPPPPPHRCW